ncbi:MAG: excisionase family DNA-binding protein [Gemmobacter sp.]|uniref:excisionase family DNA-binding protein n=1 Tax=Gemmobacter sp. TaxID=1898957 RepID=UPI00391B4974
MPHLSTTDLAAELGVSKGRVSQWVSEGKLRGTFTGDGRARRFDLAAVQVALNRSLDVAQALGNGRQTLERIGAISAPPPPADDADDTAGMDADIKRRYDIARAMRIEEQARAARYDNDQREATLVLASEVQAQVLAQIGQELAQIDGFLRQVSVELAEALGAQRQQVRAILNAAWRRHRGERAAAAAMRADAAKLTAAEQEADF